MGEHAGVPSQIQEAGNKREALAAVHHEALGRLSLDAQVGVPGRIKAAGQLGDNISRDVERQICADLVGPARQLTLQEIRVDERYVRRVSEPAFKSAKDSRINLVGHDMSAALRKWRCKRASPGPDIEDEVVGRDRGLSEELACEPSRPQKVLAVFGSAT